MLPFARKMKFPWIFLLKAKFNKKCPFWAEGCILGQNSRKLTPPKISFYCQSIITLPTNNKHLFSCLAMASVWFWWHFHSFCFLKLLFAEKYSRCSNSLNFEVKINFNTSKPNVPKWRKTFTWLQFDMVHFNGPQSHLLSGGNLWGPCSSLASSSDCLLYSELETSYMRL